MCWQISFLLPQQNIYSVVTSKHCLAERENQCELQQNDANWVKQFLHISTKIQNITNNLLF